MPRFRSEWQVQRQVVTLGQQPFKGHKNNLMPANEFHVGDRFVSEQAHPEALGPYGDSLANVSESGDAEHAAAQRHSALRSPLPCLGIPMLGDQTLGQGHKERKGVLGDAIAIGSRRRGHCDSMLGGCFQIDRIKADTDACNNP
jgi:hypothetical protein